MGGSCWNFESCKLLSWGSFFENKTSRRNWGGEVLERELAHGSCPERETDLFSIMKGNPCSTQDYVDVPGRFHHDIVHSIWSLMFRTKLNSIIVSSSTTAAAGWAIVNTTSCWCCLSLGAFRFYNGPTVHRPVLPPSSEQLALSHPEKVN